MISIVASSITVYHSSTHTLATPLRVLRVAPLHVNVGSAFHDPTASIRPIHAIFIMLLDGGGGGGVYQRAKTRCITMMLMMLVIALSTS